MQVRFGYYEKKKQGFILKFCRTHLQDLKDVTSDVHYESFRSQQLLGKRNLNNIYE
jgi:septin family protein